MNDPDRIKSADRTPRHYSSPSSSPHLAKLPTALLTVAGLTPQIITETLYCLLVQTAPPVDVRAVHVLTTRVGEEKVRDQLLRKPDGWFHRFCRDYRIPAGKLRFDSGTIHVFEGADGELLDDVRTPADNSRVADSVLTMVRDLTRDPAVALHASVAGGRKTMGLFLGIAFQLFARPQDRLSHVLVSPSDLESHAGFYYPAPAATSYPVKGKRIRARDVRVELAEIPILMLRGKVGGVMDLPYSALVRQGQMELDRLTAPPSLSLHVSTGSLRVAGQAVSLTPLEFALYGLLAERRARCRTPACDGCAVCGLEAIAFDTPPILEELRNRVAVLGTHDDRLRQLKGWSDAGYRRFREVRSRINQKIRQTLGPGKWVNCYLIASSGKRPDTLYYLRAAPALFRLE